MRGQATVELALGVLLFITVLTVGLHLAEVSWLSLKVQEAGAQAMWDATGRRMHDYARMDNVAVRDASIARAEAATRARYRDYVSYGGDRGAGARLVFSRASAPEIRCRPNSAIADWSDVESRAFEGNRPVFTQEGLRADSGLECRAQARMSPFGLPVRFHDQAQGGFFQVKNYAGPATLGICSLGTAVGGECSQGYATLTDDWGLNGLADESRHCSTDPRRCPNRGYRRLVQAVYRSLMDESVGSVPEVDLSVVAGLVRAATQAEVPTGPPERFWFSYGNADTGFVDPGYPAFDEGGERWNTGPGEGSRDFRVKAAWANRQDAWLGMPSGWAPPR
jgi:hypothetical protein